MKPLLLNYQSPLPSLMLMTLFWIGAQSIAHSQDNLFPIEDYLIDDQHSYIGFKIKYFGFSPVRGRFNSFRGHILYDTSGIQKTSASLFIDVSSINTGVQMRDEDLRGSHWFDSEKFPHISFQSISVRATENGFQVEGLLQIKSKIDTVSINFESPTQISRDFAGNKQVDFSGRFRIRRSDFGIMGEGFWNSLMDGKLKQLADEVEIELDIHCRRPDYLIREADLDPMDIRKTLIDRLETASDMQRNDILSSFDSKTQRDSAKLTSGALNTIGYIMLAKNKIDIARQIFECRLKWFPQSKTTVIALAKVSALSGNPRLTRQYLDTALEADSTETLALELMRMLSDHNE